MQIDPIELSRELISFNTINPPGNELSCILHLERILTAAGLETSLQTFAPDRANLIAKTRGDGSKPPLCFTGHVDTVPLGNAPWSVRPMLYFKDLKTPDLAEGWLRLKETGRLANPNKHDRFCQSFDRFILSHISTCTFDGSRPDCDRFWQALSAPSYNVPRGRATRPGLAKGY